MKAAILVNGVPASGKSSVARAVSSRLSAPLMTLDSVKQPLFAHFGTGDREHNRKLGRASYEIIFSTISDWPDSAVVVIDAWWCHAPPSVVGERYASRVATRSEGHPGLEYVPELVALAERAKPTGCAPWLAVDTTKPLEIGPVLSWLEDAMG